MKILDLFCGAGGFSLGFKWVFPKALFLGVDIDKWACATYKYNIGEVIRADVRHLPLRVIPGLFDIIIGGPPCEPFSRLSKKRGPQHPLHDLTLWFLLHCLAFKPKVFVMENVPEILNDPFYGPLIKRLTSKQKTLDEYLREPTSIYGRKD